LQEPPEAVRGGLAAD